jgi:hypothetical protein
VILNPWLTSPSTNAVDPSDADGDDVSDDQDSVTYSDFRTYVDVNGFVKTQTSILNKRIGVDSFGRTIQDRVNACQAAATSQQSYLGYINQLAHELRTAGTISATQETEMRTQAVWDP